MPQSASRRHREKINATLEELGGLLPLPEESRSKLDKLTVLKLSVSFFQTHNYLQSGKYNSTVCTPLQWEGEKHKHKIYF